MRSVAIVIALVGAACSSDAQRSARNPISTFSSAPAPTSAPAPVERPFAAIATTDPTELATLLAAAAAAPPVGSGAPSAETTEGLRAAAAKSAADYKPAGDVGTSTLFEGGHAEVFAVLETTKCYALVAFGPKVAELDITVLSPPFYNQLAGQDATQGSAAVIAAMCPQLANAEPYKFDLLARKGSGPVAVQLYAKSK